MHELSITRNVVAICAQHAQGARVARVRLEIGALSGVLPDAVRFCFDLCAQGTPVEGAQLEILERPGRAVCRACGGEVALDTLIGRCRCGSSDLQLTSGAELNVKDMEVL
jgi:hydrogenase nickel incorporation protein HypA/HybF